MNCSDWEIQIASESADPAIAEHLAACPKCREFASELAANAASLRALDVDAAAYTAVRARVLEAVRPKHRFGWLWVATATTVAASLAFLWWTAPLRAPVPVLGAVTARIAPPDLPPPPAIRTEQQPLRRRAPRPQPLTHPQPQLAAIKLLTSDPNVVIIWLVDNKKGDSL